jgi:two-component system phosphate regulon sensor histidine kinase PhoR
MIASLLMSLSILLLVLLQAYWLRNAFKDEYHRLKREAGMNLRFTVMQEQFKQFAKQYDSAQMETLVLDAHGAKRTVLVNSFSDSVKRFKPNVFFGNDSVRPPMPPRIFSIEQEGRANDEKYNVLVVDFPLEVVKGAGTNVSAIEKTYRAALLQNGITLHFTFSKVKPDTNRQRHDPENEIKISLGSEASNSKVRMFTTKTEMLQASFENPVWFLLKRIQWPLFFALAMIAITTLAFVFLYRNLLQQQRLADMKSDLISNITHELKTPVATVSVAIEALKNFDAIHDAEKTKTYLDISAGELQRLNLLVDRVLKLSLFEQQQINLQKEPVELEQLVSEVITSLKLQFEKHGATLNYRVHGNGFYTKADRMHLIGVFYNLLDNALKYSPVSPVIEIDISKTEIEIIIKVLDNGIGIPEAYRKKVFEKFFRVPHGDTHNIKGYGLGLSYVCEVIKRHGGNIKVQPATRQGSEFIVTLPFYNAS